jgi:hypothetical protein
LSLVVAEATANGPVIVSDTRVLYPSRRSAYKTGTLKTVVLRRDVAVSFAGSVQAALETIREIASDMRQGTTLEAVISRLHDITEGDHGVCEFIVAVDGTDWQLTRIRNGQVESGLRSTWIGDHDAFEQFQRLRNAPHPLKGVIEEKVGPGAASLLRLGTAMEALINDASIESVDHFCVRVARQRDGGFQYMASIFIYVGRDIEMKPGDDLINSMAQSVAEGGYSVSIVEPAEPGTPALGLSFPRARLGMIFLPLEYDEGQVLHDISPNDFARVVQERFGVAMKDPVLRH